MKRYLIPLFVMGALNVAAQTVDFTVTLDAAQAGGGGRTGSGSGTLTLDTSQNTLSLNNIVWGGLSGTSTLAHIHGPADPGVPAGVIYDLQPYATGIPGGQSGDFNGVIQLMDPQAGMSLSQQLTDLQNDQWYINIHSSAFGGGEIRGQIVFVPEPSTFVLMGLGGVGLLWRWRRRM